MSTLEDNTLKKQQTLTTMRTLMDHIAQQNSSFVFFPNNICL